jgi:hypothetical protein
MALIHCRNTGLLLDELKHTDLPSLTAIMIKSEEDQASAYLDRFLRDLTNLREFIIHVRKVCRLLYGGSRSREMLRAFTALRYLSLCLSDMQVNGIWEGVGGTSIEYKLW